MRLPSDTLRGWIIPAALVATATLLTVPWTYWVIKAVYDRDVLDGARTLARRVELRVLLTPNYSSAPQQASEALATELTLDQTVQTAAFFDLRSKQPVGWTRLPGTRERTFTADEIRRRAGRGIIVEQQGESYDVSIPWVQDNRVLGFTYLEFSRAVLSDEFWQ